MLRKSVWKIALCEYGKQRWRIFYFFWKQSEVEAFVFLKRNKDVLFVVNMYFTQGEVLKFILKQTFCDIGGPYFQIIVGYMSVVCAMVLMVLVDVIAICKSLNDFG